MQQRMVVTARLGVVASAQDGRGVQMLQVKAPYQQPSDIPLFGMDGMVSRPLPGAQVLVLEDPRDPSKAIAVAAHDPRYYRQGLENGTRGFTHHLGAHVLAFADRLEVDGGGRPVVIKNASKVRIEGDLEVTGEVTAKAGTGASVTLTQHLQNGQKPTPGT